MTRTRLKKETLNIMNKKDIETETVLAHEVRGRQMICLQCRPRQGHELTSHRLNSQRINMPSLLVTIRAL